MAGCADVIEEIAGLTKAKMPVANHSKRPTFFVARRELVTVDKEFAGAFASNPACFVGQQL